MEITVQALNKTNMNEGFENIEHLINKRKRKKSNYRKINNETRQKLIEMVYLDDYLLKDAARILGVNYSTAKTILRIFRIEKRVEKKKADEERELKNVIYNFKHHERKESDGTGSVSPTNFCTNNPHCFSDEEKREPTFKLISSDSSKSLTNFKILINDNGREFQNEQNNNHNLKENFPFENNDNEYKNQSKNKKTSKESKYIDQFTNQFRKLNHLVEYCFNNIKQNQIMINSLINNSANIMSNAQNESQQPNYYNFSKNYFPNNNFDKRNQSSNNNFQIFNHNYANMMEKPMQ
jgi:hypothetical protein